METIGKAITDFLDHCKNEKDLSDKTLKAYGIDLAQFHQFLEEELKQSVLTEIDKDVMNNYVNIICEKGKPKTAKRKVATLRAFFNFLEFEDRITVSPFRKMNVKIKLDHTQPETLTLEEVQTLLSYLYQKRQNSRYDSETRQKALYRDIAIVELLIATGMRVSEICSLSQSDLDLDKKLVRIAGQSDRDRVVPLMGDDVVKALRAYQSTHERDLRGKEFLFVNRDAKQISDQTIRAMINKYCREVGITKKITPHTFRHTVASLLLSNGVDVRFLQYFLGHSSIASTQNYAQIDEEAQRVILNEKFPRGQIQMGNNGT